MSLKRSTVSTSQKSSSFVIRVNLLHSQPSLFLVSLWFNINISLVFSTKLVFSDFLQFKGNFVRVQNKSKIAMTELV